MRKRDHAFLVRLNSNELFHLKQQVARSGLSREVYMRKLIMCKEIKERPQRDCIELLREVRAQGKLVFKMVQDAQAQGYIADWQIDRLTGAYKDLLAGAKALI